MTIDLSNNANEFALELRAVGVAIERGLDRGVRAGGEVLLEESRKALQSLIYARPIPLRRRKRGGAGKPAWRRTGRLKDGERLKFETISGGAQVSLENEAPYAQWRALLKRKSPTDGQTREANWRAKARDAGAARAERAVIAAIEQAL